MSVKHIKPQPRAVFLLMLSLCLIVSGRGAFAEGMNAEQQQDDLRDRFG
ncbi:MAG: hypothetical protein IK099_10270 [Clostridia bacterium]|nr:hypothetical protein [Clostridia bacterium]